MTCFSIMYAVASLQFTESGYSGIESSRKITTIVQLLTDIATDLIIAVVPVNFTFVATQIGLPSSFPNEYWSSTTNASSEYESLIEHVSRLSLSEFSWYSMILRTIG